jgi:nucleoside-diphosphate-sugar epimerase
VREIAGRVLVTGATGFVGGHLCETLTAAGYIVRSAVRTTPPGRPLRSAEVVLVGEIDKETHWEEALRGVDLVVHAAARAHVLGDPAANSHLYFDVNAHGTHRLALAAAKAGVQRFVYLSSIKVNGEESVGRAYSSEDVPQPQDPYGASKLLGERLLAEVGANSKMAIATVRPPLVYGSGVRANFLRLLSWVHKGVPLPLGAVKNTRSLISVWNLCDLVMLLLQHPAAPGQVWLASDGLDLSTPGLITRLGAALARPVHLLPVPVGLLRLGGLVCGKRAMVERLCGSLVVDITPTRDQLGWSPPLSVDDSLARTAAWYLSGSDRG